MVGTSWINTYSIHKKAILSLQVSKYINLLLTVFVRNDFPELGTDLVTTLTTLHMNNFTHFEFWNKVERFKS